MMRSLWTAASGMRAQQVNVDTIANNIANVNTTGYKTQQASFKSLLYQNLQSKSTNNAGELKPVPAEVGLGSRVSAITASFTEGELLATEDPFSMAIEGDGFFQVRNVAGEILYTRDGTFNISPLGDGNLLCTADGYPVLDQNGNRIVLPLQISRELRDENGNLQYDENGNVLMETKKIVASEMSVSQAGVISYKGFDERLIPLTNTDAAGQGYEVRFGLYQFNNPAGLEKVGDNNYAVTPASGDAVAEGEGGATPSKVHQRYREGSNVDVANEIVNLIVAQRAYEMNSKAIQATDDMMQQANNLRS